MFEGNFFDYDTFENMLKTKEVRFLEKLNASDQQGKVSKENNFVPNYFNNNTKPPQYASLYFPIFLKYKLISLKFTTNSEKMLVILAGVLRSLRVRQKANGC